MKSSIKLSLLFSLSLGAPAFSEETVPEKAKVVKNDVARAGKKVAHRVEEMVCLKSDTECLAKKAKHRVTEAVDATDDKADELKNKVDSK